jgi:hypothetical protein
MFVSKLPPKPDLWHARCRGSRLGGSPHLPSRPDRKPDLQLVQQRKPFIYVLMILLRTDEASAAVVFATLNTTRARLDLIQRLAKIRVSDKALSKNLAALIERFSESTKVRNELNRCMFIFDSSGAITHTQSMRWMETRSSLSSERSRRWRKPAAGDAADDPRMMKINREIWDLLPRFEAHICGARPQSVPLDAAWDRPAMSGGRALCRSGSFQAGLIPSARRVDGWYRKIRRRI